MRYIGFAVKLVLSSCLVLLFVPRINTGRFLDLLLDSTTFFGIAAAVCGLLLQSVLAAIRQVKLLSLLGYRVTFTYSLRVWFIGLFVSQVLVTFIAGDVVRAVQFARIGIPRRMAGRAVVLDRVIGLVVLLMLILASAPAIWPLLTGTALRFSFTALCIAAVVGIVFFFAANFLGRAVALLPWDIQRYWPVEVAVDLVSVSRFLVRAPAQSLGVAAISIVMHLLNVVAILLIARAMGVVASPWVLGAIVLPTMFLSMLPVSFAGWGVREAALVTGLGLVHVPADVALTISVGFGLSAMLASLPGLPAMLYRVLPAKLPSDAREAGEHERPQPTIPSHDFRAASN